MSERRGILLVMYDLPVNDSAQRSKYAHFRKNLLGEGYQPFQESVYLKLIRNLDLVQAEIDKIGKLAPEEGAVNVLPLTLNDFKRCQAVRGERFNFGFFSDDVVYV